MLNNEICQWRFCMGAQFDKIRDAYLVKHFTPSPDTERGEGWGSFSLMFPWPCSRVLIVSYIPQSLMTMTMVVWKPDGRGVWCGRLSVSCYGCVFKDGMWWCACPESVPKARRHSSEQEKPAESHHTFLPERRSTVLFSCTFCTCKHVEVCDSTVLHVRDSFITK